MATAQECPATPRFDEFLYAAFNPVGFRAVSRVMLNQVARFPRSGWVLFNAARTLEMSGSSLTLPMLRRVAALDGRPGDLRLRLAIACRLFARHSFGASRRIAGTLAMKEYEVLSSTRDGHLYLDDMAEAALWAGELFDAERWATDALFAAERDPSHWDAGNKTNGGHHVLGLVALARHDLSGAREHLRASCKGTTSPQLTSNGPDMLLARALLARGAREDVVEFLTDCEQIWPRGFAFLEKWKADITRGGTPTLDRYEYHLPARR